MDDPLEQGSDRLAWHYTDGPGLLSILTGHTLWATSSAFLNDAQEVALGVARLSARLRELALDDDTYQLIIDGLNPHGDDTMASMHCYILSASGSGDSLAMWRLYGRSRESYAIGLDTTARLSVLGDGVRLDAAGLADAGIYLNRKPWEPVRYGGDAQAELIETVVRDLPATLTELRSAATSWDRSASRLPDSAWPLVQKTLDDLEQALVLIKHEGFVDEREIRHAIVMHAHDNRAGSADLETRLLNHRPTPYGMAPFLRLTSAQDDGCAVVDEASPLPIRAIAISPSPNGAAAEQSVRQLLRAGGYRDVDVVRSAIPYRD